MKWLLQGTLLVFLLLACSNTKTAGSASETTNGTVAGIVVDSAGHGVMGVTASLIRVDVDPLQVRDSSLWMTGTTNAQGEYYFASVPLGIYRLVVRSADESQAATIQSLAVDSAAEVALPSLAVENVGSIRIRATDFAFALGDRFFIPGTDMSVTVSAADVVAGSVVLAAVPTGEYTQIIYNAQGSGYTIPLLQGSIQIKGAELVFIPNYQVSTATPVGFGEHAVGGAGGDTVDVTDSAGLVAALGVTTARVIRIRALIMGHGGVVKLSSNKTLLGVGDSVGFDSLGVIIRADSNIVIRNLLFRRAFDDAVGIEESAKNIWVDHNSFEKCGDGLVDIKRASEWITVSWNHFSRHKSVSVIGHSDDNGAQDSTHLHVTFHHNWFDHVEGAAPRVRFGTVHAFNNVYDSLTSYGVASTDHALVVVESNVFRNTKIPTEIRHTSPLDGDLVARNNLLIASGVPAEFGTAFDPATYYSANVDAVELVEPAVLYGAGAGKLR